MKRLLKILIYFKFLNFLTDKLIVVFFLVIFDSLNGIKIGFSEAS
jgi:hypothetical protein